MRNYRSPHPPLLGVPRQDVSEFEAIPFADDALLVVGRFQEAFSNKSIYGFARIPSMRHFDQGKEIATLRLANQIIRKHQMRAH